MSGYNAIKYGTFEGVQEAVLPKALINERKTVTNAGTAEALGNSTTLKNGILIKPLSSNSGIVYIGNSAVSSVNGYPLSAIDSPVFIAIDDLSKIYIDSAENGDGISYIGG